MNSETQGKDMADMKRIIKITSVAAALSAVTLTTAFSVMSIKADDSGKSSVTQLMDCFLPMPIIEPLTTDCWGFVVGARDQGNGLEDRDNTNYCYWDGKILKDKDTGTFYMFASRWDEANGHNGWYGSNAVYATSDNLYGPYKEHGLLNDQGGKGHNVWPLELHEGDPHGKYAIIVSETRDGDVFVSDSLDGPWKNIGKLRVNEGYWQSNTCVVARPDGKYEIINRTGDIAISDDLMGTYEIQTRNIWKQVRGMPTECIEDAVVWYSDGLYHCTVNKWDARNAYYLTSENGVDGWELNPGSAYQPDQNFLRYTDGTVNYWNKIERPNVYIEDGEVKAVTLSVIDVPKDEEKGHDNHGSKVIVVPFDGKKLHEFAKEQRDTVKAPIQGDKPIADTCAMFWNNEHSLNSGAKGYIQLQRKIGGQYGLFGESLTVENDKWAESKIGYLKFDISKYDLAEMGKATLSLIFNDNYAGDSETNRIMVSLAGSDWIEGTGTADSNDVIEDGALTWDNKPELTYDPDDIEGSTAVSDEFYTSLSTDLGQEINIDVTKLLNRLQPGETTVTFAICETAGNQRIAVCSRESGANSPILSITPKSEATPKPIPSSVPQTTDGPSIKTTNAPAEQITVRPAATQNQNKITLGKAKVAVKALKNGKIKISWKKIKGADGYQILISNKKNGRYKTIAAVSKPSIARKTIKKLKAGKKYYVRVRAFKKVRGKKIKGRLSNAAGIRVK